MFCNERKAVHAKRSGVGEVNSLTLTLSQGEGTEAPPNLPLRGGI